MTTTNELPAAPAGSPAEEPPLLEIELNGGSVLVRYDSRKWTPPQTDDDGILSLDRKAEQGTAAIIAERAGIPPEQAIDNVLEEVRKKHPDLEVLCREKRAVNGHEVWCLKYSTLRNEIPYILYMYCYGGLAGTVQVRTCAVSAHFDECEPDFTELLNGLVIHQPKHARFARFSQSLIFAGKVCFAGGTALGIGLFRFAIRMPFKTALLCAGILASGLFIGAGIYDMVKFKLK